MSALKQSAKPKGHARWLAFLAIQAFEQRGAFVSSVLDDLFASHQIRPLDRRFATELASEVVRRRLTLETVLNQFVSRPRADVQDELWILLQLGCCQLLFLPHIPRHAAVHETVKLCDRLRKSRAKAFINGVLRNIARESSSEERTENARPTLTDWESNRLPVFERRGETSALRSVTFSRPLLASPSSDPIVYISQVTSLPTWMVDRWQKQFDELDEIFRMGLWFTTPGRMTLRVNPLQTTREKVLEVLLAAKIEATPGRLPEEVNLVGSTLVRDLPGFHEGWFSVQDESAQSAVDLLSPQSGERILDLCAAPGGKTCHLAERLAGMGTVVACDISEKRLKSISENVTRLRLKNVELQQISAEGAGIPAGPYDAALVDVPCSNTGVLGKRPEARWRLSPESFEHLIPLQRELLQRAIDLLKPGGRVVYSTCSIDREENQGVVQSILSKRSDLTLIEERIHQPGNPADGGYQALLKVG